MAFDLTGRVALVTGASRGLGWSAAQALARHGATVVLNARSRAALEAKAGELTAAGLRAQARPFDATASETAGEAVAAIACDHGRLDILINNAGIIHRQALPEHGDADWRRVIELNLTAPFVLAREASKPMVAAAWGRIVNIGTVFGLIARANIPGYVAAKHGLAGLTKALAVELAPRGVTVNTLAPGFFATEFNANLKADPEFDAMVRGRTPVGRWGAPEELGHAVVFLASEEAAYVTGAVLAIDGGMTAAF